MRFAVVAMAVAVAAAVAPLRAGEPSEELRRLQRDRAEAAEVLQRLVRNLPLALDPAAEIASIRLRGERHGIGDLRVEVAGSSDRLRFDDGSPAPFATQRYQVAGTAPFSGLQRLMVPIGPGIRIDSLQVRPIARGRIAFELTLSRQSFALDDGSAGEGGDVRAQLRAESDRMQKAIALATRLIDDAAKSEAFLRNVGTFMTAVESEPIALTKLDFSVGAGGANEAMLEGVLASSSDRAALIAGLSRASFSADAVTLAAQGDCQAFRLRTTVDAKEDDGDSSWVVLDNGVFDAATARWCSPEPQAPLDPLVIGTAREAIAPMVRLRGVTLAEVFFVLNDLTAQSFVVQPDVRGRLDLVIHESATLDEIFAQLGGSGAVVGPGPVHMVSRRKVGRAAPRLEGAGSEPVTVRVQNARMADLLCVMFERAVMLPLDQDPRVTVFAEETQLDLLLGQIVGGSGFEAAVRGDRVDLTPVGASPRRGFESRNACVEEGPDEGSRLEVPATLRARTPSFADIRLAGLARVGESWRAYAWLSDRKMHLIEPGQKLADGQVLVIDGEGLSVLAGGERVRIELTQ